MNNKRIQKIFLILFLYISRSIAEDTLSYNLSEIDFSQLPFKFEIDRTLGYGQSGYFWGKDLNNDTQDELVFVYNDLSNQSIYNYLEVDEINSYTTCFRKNYKGRLSNLSFFDVNMDKSPEILFSETRHDTDYIHAIDQKGNSIFCIPAFFSPAGISQKWFRKVSPELAIDINGDDWPDIVYANHKTETYQSRGLYAYDVHNSKLLWTYPTGFVPNTVQLFDYNKDGFREILFGADAPCNGSEELVNGTNDCETYITVIDSLGKFCYKNKTGDQFSNVNLFAHDLDGDSKPEIVLLFCTHSQPPLSNYIGLWNYENSTIAPKISMEKGLLNQLIFADCDRNGQDDFLACWADGTVEWRDGNLEIIYVKVFSDFLISNIFQCDVNNDGDEEIFLLGLHRGRDILAMVNRNLELLACYSGGKEHSGWIDSALNQGFGKEKLLIVNSADVHLTFRIKKQTPLISGNDYWRSFFPFVAGMIIAILNVVLWNFFVVNRRVEKKLRLFLLANQDAVAIFDNRGKLIYSNSSMSQLLNFKTSIVSQIQYQKFFDTSEWNKIINWIDQSFKTRLSVEKELVTLKGSCSKIFVVRIFPMNLFRFKKIQIVTINEITELVQSKRAVAWAGMAQRLAHEIKTPLSTVMLSAQRLEMEFESNPEHAQKIAKYLYQITNQVDRLRKMTDAFLKFTSIEKLQFERISIHDLIMEVWQREYAGLGLSVQVKFNFHPETFNINGDRGQLIIALKNIIDNSTQAMQGKGIVTVTTRTVQTLLDNSGNGENNWVQIEISDTGCGISHEQQKGLFQPFTSHKEGGTGLGLVIARKIIQDHHGAIKINSEVGIGTSLFIDLPMALTY
jgi:nitrogen-specific signal transduction histidine kinase